MYDLFKDYLPAINHTKKNLMDSDEFWWIQMESDGLGMGGSTDGWIGWMNAENYKCSCWGALPG